jgi:hypothetical protein
VAEPAGHHGGHKIIVVEAGHGEAALGGEGVQLRTRERGHLHTSVGDEMMISGGGASDGGAPRQWAEPFQPAVREGTGGLGGSLHRALVTVNTPGVRRCPGGAVRYAGMRSGKRVAAAGGRSTTLSCIIDTSPRQQAVQELCRGFVRRVGGLRAATVKMRAFSSSRGTIRASAWRAQTTARRNYTPASSPKELAQAMNAANVRRGFVAWDHQAGKISASHPVLQALSRINVAPLRHHLF